MMNIKKSGTRDIVDMANKAPQELVPVASTKLRKANDTVNRCGELRYTICEKKSFQVQMNVKIETVTNAGTESGKMKLK